MPYIIGIDLGTTNTAVAVLENGRPRVIEDDRGYKVLPSVVSAKTEGRFVVGQAAHNLILTRPDRTVYAVKRLMGRRFDSSEVQRVMKRVGYAIREAPDGGVQVQVGDTWMTPSEVAAVVLQVARGIAEKALDAPIVEAVITVPANFNHAQRKATLEAAEIAGLRCDRIINEPTAAALGYGHRRNVDRTLAIFDLGGGTFDVSVLRLSGGLYEILSSNGDTFLGGEDFDFRLVDHLADYLKARTGVDIHDDRAALQRVKDAAERAKCELSFSDRANIIVPHVAAGKNLETVITRTQLEDLTRDLVERCVEVARDAVAHAGLTMSDIDEVILVGGQTRMPLVREAVAGLFGREPSRSVHPEEAVAIGAAVHAASLGDVEGPAAVLLDVAPFDLGIDSAGGMFSRVVQKNARIPCAETRTFATAHDNQDTVRLTVRQGESRIAEENEFLGEFMFEGLTPAPRMQTKVGVTFRIDANGMLHVTAIEAATGERRNIVIRNYADRNRAVIGAAVPRDPGAGAGAPVAGSANVKKKAGFFDQLFGAATTPKKAKTKKPKAEKGEKAEKVVDAAASASALRADPSVLAPPPVIQALSMPVDTEDEALQPMDGDDLGLEPLDEDSAFEMPDEYAAMEAELYEPGPPANFGLAGAHQVGEEGPSGDPFADLGTPMGLPDADGPGDWGMPDEERLDAADLFGSDGDLFGEAPEEEDEQDPPTDPGLTFPRASSAPTPPPVATAVPPAPVHGGLLFESLVESDTDPDTVADFGFDLSDAAVTSADDEAPVEEDSFGFSFEDLEGPVVSERAPPPMPEPPSTKAPPAPVRLNDRVQGGDATEIFRRPVLDDDTHGFAFPMPEGELAREDLSKKPRKPARVKLQYRERALLVAEYTENIQRGGALIRTEKPLASGRECVFEINGPGLAEPLVIPAWVSRVVVDGMEVQYRLDAGERSALLARLAE